MYVCMLLDQRQSIDLVVAFLDFQNDTSDIDQIVASAQPQILLCRRIAKLRVSRILCKQRI